MINVINPTTPVNDLAKRSYEIAEKRGQLKEDCLVSLGKEYKELFDEMLKNQRQSIPAPSEHLPQYTGVQEELADIILVAMTTLHSIGTDVGKLLSDKTAYNEQR